MLKADELREILKNQYGITSDAELEIAIDNMQGVNIELFVPAKEKGQAAIDIKACLKKQVWGNKMGRYILPDHPAIREAEMYGWPRIDNRLDDEMSMMFDDEVDDYDDVAKPARLEV